MADRAKPNLSRAEAHASDSEEARDNRGMQMAPRTCTLVIVLVRIRFNSFTYFYNEFFCRNRFFPGDCRGLSEQGI
jgi:hypothetical protein